MPTFTSFLKERLEEMRHGDLSQSVAVLSEELTDCRLAVPEDEWTRHVLPACRARQLGLAEFLLQDPYTRRAWDKPRGYAGDAVMMDYMYFCSPPSGCSETGRQVFVAITASPNAASVRWRREHIAGLIDGEAQRRGCLSVLAVACGHCREGLLLRSETLQSIEQFVALDQDRESLEVVSRTLPAHFTPMRMTIKALCKEPAQQRFDLIYSAGLFDYLSDPVAVDLTGALLERAVPGGTVLVANFTPDNWGRGYMEAFMDWKLVLRTRDDMRRLIPAKGVASSSLYFDPYRNVVYLKMIKA